MAERGGGTSLPEDTSISSTAGSVVCALCLDVFRFPKILPCFHSFCEHCLQDLVIRYRNEALPTFPCPICRKEIDLPSGGASSFQANFHIDPDDLEKTRGGARCPKHPKRELELCCTTCDYRPICARCIPDHQQHVTKDIIEAAERARDLIYRDMIRLKGFEEKIEAKVSDAKKQQQELQDKCLGVEKDIRARHATLVAAADMYFNQALLSLEAVTSDIERSQLEVHTLLSNKNTLAELRGRVQEALDSGVASKLVSASWSMQTGLSKQGKIAELVAAKGTTVRRPVLHFDTPQPSFFDTARRFIGDVKDLKMTTSAPEGTMMMRFQYGQDDNLEVYSLCPLDDGSVWLAFELHFQLGYLSPCRVSRTGEVLGTGDKLMGRVTFAPMTTPTLCQFMESTQNKSSTYSKRRDSTSERFWMDKSKIYYETVLGDHPVKFSVHCPAHRAFDVNKGRDLFAVLKESKLPNQQRKVRLFGQNIFQPIAKYRPPIKKYRFSDVCFYTLGGKEVLLVADELNDAIHVVKVQKKGGLVGHVSKWNYELVFSRYLAPGWPLLRQPNALNTDGSGRLWVACRGGRILTFQPSEQPAEIDSDTDTDFFGHGRRLLCV